MKLRYSHENKNMPTCTFLGRFKARWRRSIWALLTTSIPWASLVQTLSSPTWILAWPPDCCLCFQTRLLPLQTEELQECCENISLVIWFLHSDPSSGFPFTQRRSQILTMTMRLTYTPTWHPHHNCVVCAVAQNCPATWPTGFSLHPPDRLPPQPSTLALPSAKSILGDLFSHLPQVCSNFTISVRPSLTFPFTLWKAGKSIMTITLLSIQNSQMMVKYKVHSA